MSFGDSVSINLRFAEDPHPDPYPPKDNGLNNRRWWIMWRWYNARNGPASLGIDPGDSILLQPGDIVIKGPNSNGYTTHIKVVGRWNGDQTVFKVVKRTSQL